MALDPGDDRPRSAVSPCLSSSGRPWVTSPRNRGAEATLTGREFALMCGRSISKLLACNARRLCQYRFRTWASRSSAQDRGRKRVKPDESQQL